MLNQHATRLASVLAECAEIPLEADDAELMALAIALHLETALELTLPREVLDHEHLVPPAALARTVRDLVGGS